MKEYGEEEGGPCQGVSWGLSGNSLDSTAAQYLYLTNLTNTECPCQGISWGLSGNSLDRTAAQYLYLTN